MKKVDFFLAGNLKSGTTTFYGLLKQHPEIYVPDYKEPKFFCTDFHRESDEYHGKQVNYPIRTLDKYHQLYENAKEDQILGDCSPHYTYSKEAAKNIYEYNSEAKIIIFLREPVSFLRSLHFDSLHALNETEEDFLKALELEEMRKKGKQIPEKISTPSYLYYSEWVKYKEQIKRYVDLFGNDKVKIVFLKQIIQDQAKVYKEILKFLEVKDTEFVPDFDVTKNQSKTLRFGGLFNRLKHSFVWHIITKLVPVKFYSLLNSFFEKFFFKKASKPEISEDTLRKIKKSLLDEVKELNSYLNSKGLIDFDLVNFWGYDEL